MKALSESAEWTEFRRIAHGPPHLWSASGPGWSNFGMSRVYEVYEQRHKEMRTRWVVETVQGRDCRELEELTPVAGFLEKKLEAVWEKATR